MNPTYYLKAELKEDQHLSPNAQPSSSSSVSCHVFSNSCTQDHSKSYHWDIQQQPQNQQEAYDFASRGGSFKIEDEISESKINNIQIKWMSSKMRLMEKMKNSDRTVVTMPTSTTAAAAAATVLKLEDEKRSSSPLETDNCSRSSSNNTNNPIRVCSDCNTTKTPLWRGGPKGPKSLCNACGIRQRKARRAMAVANGAIIATKTPPNKINKAQHKVAKLCKKSCKLAVTPSHGRKKLCFEDFLISVSNNLACQRVFPQDEKEAAILLMALSCGHLHG